MKFKLKRVKINWNSENSVDHAIAKAKQAKTELENKGFRLIKTNYWGREAEMLYRK